MYFIESEPKKIALVFGQAYFSFQFGAIGGQIGLAAVEKLKRILCLTLKYKKSSFFSKQNCIPSKYLYVKL